MKKPYFNADNFTLYQGDCNKILKDIQEKSIDVIFADPPYFLSSGGISCKSGKQVKVDKGEWDKSFDILENLYNIQDLENGMIDKLIDVKSYFNS